MREEILQVQLPKAMDLGNTEVGSRRFDLTIFAHRVNYYTTISVDLVRVIPAFAPLHIHAAKEGQQMGQYASVDGMIPLGIIVDSDSPVTLSLYNLSIDTDVMLSIHMTGTRYGV